MRGGRGGCLASFKGTFVTVEDKCSPQPSSVMADDFESAGVEIYLLWNPGFYQLSKGTVQDT